MVDVPVFLGLLLHHIIPGVDFVFAVIVQQVERCAGKVEDVGLFLRQEFDDVLAQFGLGAFMGFIDNQEVVVGLEDCPVLIELATGHFSASHILHGCEVDVVGIRILLGEFLQEFERLALETGAVGIAIKQLEYLVEVLEPAFIDHRAVCQDEGAVELHFLHHLQSGEGLTETHLGVPEHILSSTLELTDGLFDGLLLLRAEFDFFVDGDHLIGANGEATFFGGVDGSNGGVHTTLKPFPALILLAEVMTLDTRAQQDFMDLLVVEGGNHAATDGQRQFRVPERVIDAGSLGVLVYALLGSLIQGLAVRRQG